MNLIRLDTVDSTNAAARRAVRDGVIGGRGAVVAREQTAGRGTGDRTWLSPRDVGIYLSIVEADARQIMPLTTDYTRAAGLACIKALRRTTGIEIGLRPINDLMAGGGKLGGILTEAVIEEGRLVSIIVGVGINWRTAPRPLPPGVPRAVSVEDLLPPERFAALRMDDAIDAIIRHVFADCVQTPKRQDAKTPKADNQ